MSTYPIRLTPVSKLSVHSVGQLFVVVDGRLQPFHNFEKGSFLTFPPLNNPMPIIRESNTKKLNGKRFGGGWGGVGKNRVPGSNPTDDLFSSSFFVSLLEVLLGFSCLAVPSLWVSLSLFPLSLSLSLRMPRALNPTGIHSKPRDLNAPRPAH